MVVKDKGLKGSMVKGWLLKGGCSGGLISKWGVLKLKKE